MRFMCNRSWMKENTFAEKRNCDICHTRCPIEFQTTRYVFFVAGFTIYSQDRCVTSSRPLVRFQLRRSLLRKYTTDLLSIRQLIRSSRYANAIRIREVSRGDNPVEKTYIFLQMSRSVCSFDWNRRLRQLLIKRGKYYLFHNRLNSD